MTPLCRIQLLNGLRVQAGERVISRFRTRKTALLLTYLAYHLHQDHPRELLLELLWPEADIAAGRNSLNVALSSLRRQLDPPGLGNGTALTCTHFLVRLNPERVTTDVEEFRLSLRAASETGEPGRRIDHLLRAVDLYAGPFLPGYYEDWILAARDRLAEAHLDVLEQLIRHFERRGEYPAALRYAHRAVEADPLREEARRDVMRVYVAAGQPSAALKQYREYERLLHKELGEEPNAPLRAFARNIETGQSRALDLPSNGAR